MNTLYTRSLRDNYLRVVTMSLREVAEIYVFRGRNIF